MNILILAAGPDVASREDEYPLCLTEFDSIPLIQHLTERCIRLKPNRVIVALREEDVRRHHLDSVVSLLVPNATILKIQEKTQGAACTALLASGLIDNDEDLLIVNGNELLDIDFLNIIEEFKQRLLDAGVVIFNSVHPRYSYVRLDAQGNVVEAAEKKPISRKATAGFYWFLNGKNFVNAAKNMIRKDASVNDKFYICPAFNELILNQLSIGTYEIDGKYYHPLKTERQLDRYEAALDRGRDL